MLLKLQLEVLVSLKIMLPLGKGQLWWGSNQDNANIPLLASIQMASRGPSVTTKAISVGLLDLDSEAVSLEK